MRNYYSRLEALLSENANPSNHDAEAGRLAAASAQRNAERVPLSTAGLLGSHGVAFLLCERVVHPVGRATIGEAAADEFTERLLLGARAGLAWLWKL